MSWVEQGLAAPGSKACHAFLLCTAALDAAQAWGARVAAPGKRGPRHPAATRAAPPAAAAAAPAPPGQAAAEEAAGVYPLQAAMAAMAMSIGQPARAPTEDLLGSRELADARELVRQRAAHVAAWVASGMHGEDAQARAPAPGPALCAPCPLMARASDARDARAVLGCLEQANGACAQA